MPETPLAGAWAKLERAKSHVDTFRLITNTGDTNTNRIKLRREFDEDSSTIVYRIDRMAQPGSSDEWGLILGDTVHNLRSALDHAWWQAARKHLRREPTEREAPAIQFPISSNPDEWDRTKNRYLRHVGDEHIAAVERFQPFIVREPHVLNPLAELNRLSNSDKHRVIETTILMTEGFVVDFPAADAYTDCEWRPEHRLRMAVDIIEPKPGNEAFRFFVRQTGPNPDVELEPDLSAYVAFRGGLNVFEGLDAMGKTIAIVLRDLEPLV